MKKVSFYWGFYVPFIKKGWRACFLGKYWTRYSKQGIIIRTTWSGKWYFVCQFPDSKIFWNTTFDKIYEAFKIKNETLFQDIGDSRFGESGLVG